MTTCSLATNGHGEHTVEPVPTTEPKWKSIARVRRERQLAQIPLAWRLTTASETTTTTLPHKSTIERALNCGILTPLEREMTSSSTTAGAILSKIHTGEWTSEAVCVAFCKRASLLHQITGCLTEILFDEAIARARELDIAFEQNGRRPTTSLHGLPMSIKDNHDIRGHDSTVGWVGLIGRPAAKDHPVVAEYRRLGCVLYVKTNVPQSMMMSDSYNHVWGQSVNTLDTRLISGGSSGGEGALVAGGGSVLGIGTDIGGSVRIPAALQGLYGLSPTIGRLGNRESVRAQKYIVPPVSGPLTRDLDSLELFMRSYVNARPWDRDPGILPVPWRQDIVDEIAARGQAVAAAASTVDGQNGQSKEGTARRLRIAYVIDDGVALPQPPVQRAVRETVDRLRQAGHDVFEWTAAGQYDSPHPDLATSASQVNNLDAKSRTTTASVPNSDNNNKNTTTSKATATTTPTSHRLAYDLWLRAVLADGGTRFADLCSLADEPLIQGMLVGRPDTLLSSTQRQDLAERIWSFQDAYLRAFIDAKVDAILLPVTHWVGMRPREWVTSDMYVGYTSLANLLNWTALCVPTPTRVDRAKDGLDAAAAAAYVDHRPRSFHDDWIKKQYDVGLVEGLPVGVQIMTGRFGEEAAVGVARVLAELDRA